MKTLQPMSKDKFRSLLEEERDKRAQKGVDENGEPLKIWTAILLRLLTGSGL